MEKMAQIHIGRGYASESEFGVDLLDRWIDFQ
jgi:hypothetical protein